jgi:branched-subunit amino acid transport protein AzlD
MAILVLHTVMAGDPHRSSWPAAEVTAIALVMGLQWLSRQALLSIFFGTGLYVLMVNPSLWNG